MVGSTSETLQPTEPERRIRKSVPYSGEIIWALDLRKQGGAYCHGSRPTHYTPETPEELERAEKFTQRLQELMQDDVLGGRLAYELLPMADGMMANGEISEEQYLLIHDTFDRATMGDLYHPLETPESYIETFGSIHAQPTQPTK